MALLLITLLTGCTSFKYQQEHFEALHNFTYKKDDASNSWVMYSTTIRPFKGDCEDFAFTLQNVIGGKVRRVYDPKWGYHAVLVKEGVIYDNNSKFLKLVGDYDGIFIKDMVFRGVIMNN